MRNIKILITAMVSAFFGGVFWDFYQFYKWMLTAPIWMWKTHFYLVIVLFLGSLGMAILPIWAPQHLVFLKRIRHRMGWARWVIVIGTGVFISWFFVYAKWSDIFNGAFTRLLLYIISGVLMAWLASSGEGAFSWKGSLAALVLLCTSLAVADNFRMVTDYPFGLYWSEGNRLWDYSIVYGRHLYIYPQDQIIPVYIDPGRQTLWGLPFLFMAQPSIWFVRFWSALVFTLPYALLGWFIFRPVKGRIWEWLLLGLWALLFLNQGPIYAPLVLAALLVAASRKMKLLPALLLVGLAGYYARTNRITWTFAPAMWAVMVTLVDTESPYAATAIKRWVRAGVLGVVGLSGFIIQDVWPPIWARLQGIAAAPSVVSVEGIESAGNRQPLLWNRLLPNPTNPQGIVLSLLIATLPLILLLIFFAFKKPWRLGLWQKLAIIGSLLTFLVVGIIVSVKIGGGSNLHNLDMYLLGLLFVAGLAWEYGGREWLLGGRLNWGLRSAVLLAIVLPVLYEALIVTPVKYPPSDEVNAVLDYVQKEVDDAKTQGDVLFIDHRQLLTFGYIKDVPLVGMYEKKWMMDEAMANNEEYFEPFYKDLSNRRFSLIISELMFIKWQGDTYNFGNENDAWVKWVSIPVHCYYEQLKAFNDVGLELLVPREEKLTDPKVICPMVEGEMDKNSSTNQQ